MPEQQSLIKMMGQFGFIEKGQSGDQAVGICPFCESSKMYVGQNKHSWKCHAGSCQREGGFYTFLSLIVDHCHKLLRPSGMGQKLAEDRGIRLKTLWRQKVGYNPINNSFLIPNFFFDNTKKVLNIAIYKGSRLISTSGCKLGLYGWEELYSKKADEVWLCEGAWDWLAMCDILQSLGKKKTVAVGCPGAGTFKAEWGQFFDGKDVKVIYDNDEAGKLGQHKVHNALIHYAKSLRYVHWPKKPDGYDLRDFFKDHGGRALRTLQSLRLLLNELPPAVQTKSGKTVEAVKPRAVEFTGKGIDHKEVYKSYRKWLHLPSTDIIDVLFGAVLANRLDGDPLWLFMVAPSGGTKTEMLLSISGAEGIEVISSLTPKTLVSGMTLEGGVDPSLLPKLNGKVLVIKDFTAILSMNKTHRDEILGDLRDAYDGEFSKPFGNARWKKYKSSFGILAGVTPEIEKYLSESVAMGERFLRFAIPIDNSIKGRKGFIRRALGNVANETGMRCKLQKVASKVIEHEYKTIPNVNEVMTEKVVCLAHWVCMVRGVVSRDRYSKQVTNSPYIEVGTRVAKQLCKLGMGIGMFKGKRTVSGDEYKTITKVARASVPRDYENLFRFLFRNNKEYSTHEIAEAVKLPPQLIDRVAQDLRLTGVLSKRKISAFGAKWIINPEVLELTEECGIYDRKYSE